MIEAFTDASYDTKKQVAGIGIVIINGHKRKEYALFTKCRTVNAAEIFAVYLAGILTHGQAKIHTDSQSAILYINNEVNPHRNRDREQYLNYLECKYWAYQVRNLKLEQPIEWCKGHTGRFNLTAGNNAVADSLAKLGRAKYYDNC